MVQIRLEEKNKKQTTTKPGELQMELASTKISTPKDSDGENAVKP